MVKDHVEGLIINIQRFSIHDGPGIRTTVFFKGCPLRCGWCSNPEALNPYPELMTRSSLCIRCGRCVEACPAQAISRGGTSGAILWEKCTNCLDCAELCPSGAITTVGRRVSVAEVLDQVQRDADFYRLSGGGMTLSGGEPLQQWRFAAELLQQARQRGIHTVLDTSGHADWVVLDQLLRHTDLVLFDIKHLESARHRKWTGLSNERILDNLQKSAATLKTKIWIRYPVIPGFNDTEEDLNQLCHLILELKPSVEKVSLLFYHNFAVAKYGAMGMDYSWKGAPLASKERMGELRQLVESRGIEVDVGR